VVALHNKNINWKTTRCKALVFSSYIKRYIYQGSSVSIVRISLLLTLLFSLNIYANESESCLETAMSQRDMNQCAGVDYKIAESELYRVIVEIKKLYKGEEKFLVNLEKSQQNWEAQLELDLALKFPRADEPMYYGSVFPMCYSGYKTRLALQRIAFLKEWLKGSTDGEVCSGSVMHEYYIKNGNG
jgi:uncharacterized protein YecT (DUF1311 family)